MFINLTPWFTGFGIVLAIVATVLSLILIIPEKKRENLPKLMKKLHDIFNFKSFLLEFIIKLLYTFTTLACIFVGICMLFGISFHTDAFFQTFHWSGLEGLIILVGGPIVSRLVFECFMLFIKISKDLSQINDRVNPKKED